MTSSSIPEQPDATRESSATRSSVGGYRVGRVLGRGAVATVFAVDSDEGLAIKLLHPERGARSPISAERFVREALAASRLRHPHIVRVVDHGTDESGVAYLVMEHVAGETLAARLSRGPLPISDALAIAAQLASALQHAHHHGLVHRDVKPANVLLEPELPGLPRREPVSRLVDFGLAHDRFDLPLTATGALCGTPAYMAPELVDGARPSLASDVYALGCLLFEMLTGRPPFVGALPLVFRGHAYEEPPAASTLRAEVLDSIDGLLAGALTKDPAVRTSAERLELLCRAERADPSDPVAVWTRRIDEARAAASARWAELPPPVALALQRLTRALERLASLEGVEVAGAAHDTVVRPGLEQTLAQLQLHRSQLERLLD